MLKTAGILMILTAGAGLGFGKGYELLLRERALGQILLMIRWLKGEICSKQVSLHDAFLGVAQQMSGKYREFLTNTAEKMEQSAGMRFADLYRSCAEEVLKELPLSKKEWELFFTMGGTLGYLDLDMQKKQLEFYEGEFLHSIEELRAEMPAKKKVYQSLGVMGGILLAILVW
ncbi:MAG: stage III sporulation protein AB [Eubacteriales bacterium]|nr:stage III sporulation protein AB [Eubacteriales bacterium]